MSDDAIPAATLVVWRDRPAGPEILVVERSARMAFAAGAIVFPGGRIDEGDRQLAAALGRDDQAARVTAAELTPEYRFELTRNFELGRAIGATGTPTFIVGNRVLQGAVGYEALRDAIAEARAR